MAVQTRGNIPGQPGRPPNVEYDPTKLGEGFKEANAQGVGIDPRGNAETRQLLPPGGLANPFQQIGDWWSKLTAGNRSKPVRNTTSTTPRIDVGAVNKAFYKK